MDVIEFVRNYFLISKDININKETHLILDLGLSSYSIIEMCYKFEKQFDVKISDEELTNLETVGNLIDIVDNNKKL